MTHPLLRSLFDDTERRPLSVSELTMQVRSALENRFASVWVEGEISNFKPHTSGHWYFTIRDAGAQLRATCFRATNQAIRFRPSDGLLVRARGRLTVYEPRGEYQMVVEALDPAGAGALRVAYQQTRDRLAAEGLFDPSLKRPLPRFPRCVGVVTSPTGAAVRDILNVLARRTRTVHVLFSPARVQGEGASFLIARAIELLNEHHAAALRDGRLGDCIDVLIVGRGGGSAEDLWAFNDERLARAIRASRIPVISAVGHETDFTIADLAADLRAATPSAAAEMVAELEDELCKRVEGLTRDLEVAAGFRLMRLRTRVQNALMSAGFDDVRARLREVRQSTDEAARGLESLMMRRLQTIRRRAEALSHRLSPARLGARTAAQRQRYSELYQALDAMMNKQLEGAKLRFHGAAASLNALSPLAVLERGYALARDANGMLLRDSNKVRVGEKVGLRLAKGGLSCRVEKVESP